MGTTCAMSLFTRSVQGLDRFQQRHRMLGFPFAVRQKYAEDQGGFLAASVTYYAFFSIFPLLLVLVTLLGYALDGDPDLQRRVLDSAVADFPVIGPQLEDNVHSLRGSAAALAVGIGVALWAGTGVALALENALDHIWGIPIRRRVNPLLARVRALVWIAVLGGITLVGTVLASASAVASYGPAVRVAALAVSFAINLLVFLAVFRVLTSHRPSWRDVLPGALVAATAWEVLQAVGGYIVDHQLRNASSTYGVFAIVIGLLSWIYIGRHRDAARGRDQRRARAQAVAEELLAARRAAAHGRRRGRAAPARRGRGATRGRGRERRLRPARARSLTSAGVAITQHAARTLEWSDLVRPRQCARAHVHGDQRAQRAFQPPAREGREADPLPQGRGFRQAVRCRTTRSSRATRSRTASTSR